MTLFIGGGVLGGSALPKKSLLLVKANSQYATMDISDFSSGFDWGEFGISVWHKRASTGSMPLFSTMEIPGYGFQLDFDASNKLQFRAYLDPTTIGHLVTSSSYTGTSWTHYYAQYSSSAGSGDRMRLWVNGTEVTSFSTDTDPGANDVVEPTTYDATWGARSDNPAAEGPVDGYHYQCAIFTSTLPSIGSLYSSGPVDISGVSGLHSLMEIETLDSGSINDAVISASDWTVNGGAMTSSDVPS